MRRKEKGNGHMRRMEKEGSITSMHDKLLNVQKNLDVWQMKEKSLNLNLKILYM